MVGVFDAPGDARRAIEDLRDAGFSDKSIGLLTHDKDGDPEVRSFRDRAIGPVIAGGLLAAIAASAASGAGAGLVVGALVGLGVTDEEAAYYDDEFKKGRTIVVVRGDERTELAHTILTAHHGQDRMMVPGTLADQIEHRHA
jgi:hypothetical protein